MRPPQDPLRRPEIFQIFGQEHAEKIQVPACLRYPRALESFAEGAIVLGGDFNLPLDPRIDSSSERMEDSSQENLTTRSLLKGILATEIVRPAVKHQTKRSISRASVSRIHEDKIPSSPSMSLRSQMKARVRQSYGKQALENSSVKRKANAKAKKESGNKGFHNILDELNNITPQTLLKKIIQNEDEVSIVVSQRPKTAVADRTEQEGTRLTKLSSLSSVNLSLPDLQDTEPLDVFRLSHKKKRMNISQFEREVDEKLPKNRDNSNLKETFEDLTPLVNPNVKTRSLEDHLDFSLEPQSTYKRALLRKPNKAFLVSLGDFEQGVEDKYHLIKGSQECFIESAVEDKSSFSTRAVAELNTELYFLPLVSELNNLTSEKRHNVMSSSLVSSDRKKCDTDMSLETNSINISVNVPEAVLPSIQTPALMEERSETTSNICKFVPMVEDVAHFGANQSIQKYLPMGEDAEKYESHENIHKSLSAVKMSPFGSKRKQDSNESVSVMEDDKNAKRSRSIESSVLIMGDARHFQLVSKSSLIDKDGGPVKPYGRMQKSELVGSNACPFESNENKNSERMETADSAEHEPLQTTIAEAGEKHEMGRLSGKMQNSPFTKENGNQYTKSLSGLSRQEEYFESSQGHSSDNFLQAESTMERDFASPEHQAKLKKQSLISALVETPAYIRSARFTQVIPLNKFAAGKKVHKKTSLKTKINGSTFKSSFVKQLFNLHAKMRLSKEASTEVEKLLEMFLNQMTGDLAAYTAHANRKTITLADLELLMKRQGLVTDTTSFNVLIERHLPLECRKLLISCAMHGNKVFPKI